MLAPQPRAASESGPPIVIPWWAALLGALAVTAIAGFSAGYFWR